jgi:hypothetical protein
LTRGDLWWMWKALTVIWGLFDIRYKKFVACELRCQRFLWSLVSELFFHQQRKR